MKFGYTLSSEEHGPRDLVENAQRAEAVGFDFVSVSDHFHPWVSEQGHSPFVWSVLGGVAATTSTLDVVVGVTCPTIRIHPAVIAQAAATTSLLFGDRFSFGVGTGEALNEHVLGHRWPPHEVRLRMLEEAIEVMRKLWTGEIVDHQGEFYRVENAQLFDAPEVRVPVIVSGFAEASIDFAARVGEGLFSHGTDPKKVERFLAHGGSGPRYAQINLCYGADTDAARKTVHHYWPIIGLPGSLAQDLPTTAHFEQVAELIDEETATKSTPCGPDVGAIVESVRKFTEAGFDHLYFHQIGPEQHEFLDFWERELRPALKA